MKTTPVYFTTLFLLFSGSSSGQFATGFSEGHLNAWLGDTSHFIINPQQQLQLNAPSGSTTSWMYTPVTFTDSMIWDIYLKLDFAPSTTNQLKIFLSATLPDLPNTSGYFLEIGAGGDQDPLELKYRENGNDISIATSAPGIAGTAPVEFKLRVIKNGIGEWSCFVVHESSAELLFTTTHEILPLSSTSYFGIQCKYSETRSDKFYFDDISIQPIVPDTTAPQWLSLEVIDSTTIALSFSEALDESTTLNPANYLLTPVNQSPSAVEVNESLVVLHWPVAFDNQAEYTLTLQSLKDLSGNTISPALKNFTYVNIQSALPNELLITEIMADPNPVIGLPDAEYIEVYNSSSKDFRLSEYFLIVGSNKKALPDSLMGIHQFVILCDEEDAGLFHDTLQVVAIHGFPSLTNSGATIQLATPEDVILNEVKYTDSWYGDPTKAEGGWALEMINPQFICSKEENWIASDHLSGGTPGRINSNWETHPDLQGPNFISLHISSPDKITLRFSEKLDPVLAEHAIAYAILPPVQIIAAEMADDGSLEIFLSENLQTSISYQFLPFTMYDCLGNESTLLDTILFGLPVAPEPGDLVINEILFNPHSGGSRFIEILNVSEKFIALSKLSIGRLNGNVQDIYSTGSNEIVNPGQLVVFAPDPSDILLRYEVPYPVKLFETALPSWSDKSDNASLIYEGEVIDSFTYYSNWHLPIIADQNGVSLERVSPWTNSTGAHAWHSASSLAGNATPTGQNSQLLNTAIAEKPFSMSNKLFSPDDDGFRDFLALNFLLGDGDQIGSVRVHDLEGRAIKTLITNESLGTSAFVQWDGRNAEEVVAEMGIYIIFVELWDAQGNVKEYQETCALVKR